MLPYLYLPFSVKSQEKFYGTITYEETFFEKGTMDERLTNPSEVTLYIGEKFIRSERISSTVMGMSNVSSIINLEDGSIIMLTQFPWGVSEAITLSKAYIDSLKENNKIRREITPRERKRTDRYRYNTRFYWL